MYYTNGVPHLCYRITSQDNLKEEWWYSDKIQCYCYTNSFQETLKTYMSMNDFEVKYIKISISDLSWWLHTLIPSSLRNHSINSSPSACLWIKQHEHTCRGLDTVEGKTRPGQSHSLTFLVRKMVWKCLVCPGVLLTLTTWNMTTVVDIWWWPAWHILMMQDYNLQRSEHSTICPLITNLLIVD